MSEYTENEINYPLPTRIRYLNNIHAKNVSNIVNWENQLYRNIANLDARDKKLVPVDQIFGHVKSIKSAMNALSVTLNTLFRELRETYVENPIDEGESDDTDDDGKS